MCIFAAGLVTLTKGAKREVGVSPTQSRCCKLIELKPNQICHCATP